MGGFLARAVSWNGLGILTRRDERYELRSGPAAGRCRGGGRAGEDRATTPGDLFPSERARHDERADGPQQAGMASGRNCTRSDGQLAGQVRGIGHASHVPQLQEDAAAGFVHRARHQLPAFDLLV